MANTLRLYQGTPSNSIETTLYTAAATAPSGGPTRIVSLTQIIAANVTAADATISVAVNPGGVVVADAQRIMKGLTVAANTVQVFAFDCPLLPGDTLSATQGSSAAITLTVLGTYAY